MTLDVISSLFGGNSHAGLLAWFLQLRSSTLNNKHEGLKIVVVVIVVDIVVVRIILKWLCTHSKSLKTY